MKKLAVTMVGFFVLSLTMIIAQSNTAEQETPGNDNTATAVQSGTMNDAYIYQSGDYNKAMQDQKGTKNEAAVTQGTDKHKAEQIQKGEENKAVISQGMFFDPEGMKGKQMQDGKKNNARFEMQKGLESKAESEQKGDHNHVFLRVKGDHNKATFYQKGDKNIGSTVQKGNNNKSEMEQYGTGNMALDKWGTQSADPATPGASSVAEAGVWQEGNDNYSWVKQDGTENLAGVVQIGQMNDSKLEQHGMKNTGLVFQKPGWKPAHNLADIYQKGDGNWGRVNQFNSHDKSWIVQKGDDNWALSAQAGNENKTWITQTSNGNYAYARVVNGYKNKIKLTQGGADNNEIAVRIEKGADHNLIDVSQKGSDLQVGENPHYKNGYYGGADNYGIVISGMHNKAYVKQTGNGHQAEMNIHGNGNVNSIMQSN